MALPINIEKLIHGKTIEWERLELKRSWNPEDVLHTMCAFANDIHNWGGGYIILGIVEEDGRSVLPPVGLDEKKIDAIQKKIVELGYKISPNYFPVAEPYLFQERIILVIWCPAGDNRPFEAPVSLSKNAKDRAAFIRIGSTTVRAKGENLRQLQELAARIPFDDRRNNLTELNDLDLGLIREYLQEVRSSLFDESVRMPFEDLCRTMMIAKGPNEDIRPLNIGLMFFCPQPEKFFSRAWIELVWHKDDKGRKFQEIYFKGPLHHQLRQCLAFIRNNIIIEQVEKLRHHEKAERFFNYPFAAVEEALSNAVYHKSYEMGSPIEIQIFEDKMTILSYPGPMPPVNSEIMSTQKRIIAREYRNRRVGDFLKELDLTEGRGTGFPIIYEAMKDNLSPKPTFETDGQSYVLVTLPAKPGIIKTKQFKHPIFNNLDDLIVFVSQVGDQANDQVKVLIGSGVDEIEEKDDQANDQAGDQAESVKIILKRELHDFVENILEDALNWISKSELLESLNLKNHTDNRKRYIDPLLQIGWLEIRYPDTPTHPGQAYRTTEAGKRVLKLINSNIEL